ncbi:hypothetical protein HYS82_02090 [Candidatus Amesbacteria bacterium]|nr:hypothetical protein [Candidatus Amesbacteria bacterium]
MPAETIAEITHKYPLRMEHFVGKDGKPIVAIVSRDKNGEIILEYPLRTEHFVGKDGKPIVADVSRDEHGKIILVRPGSPKYAPPSNLKKDSP